MDDFFFGGAPGEEDVPEAPSADPFIAFREGTFAGSTGSADPALIKTVIVASLIGVAGWLVWRGFRAL